MTHPLRCETCGFNSKSCISWFCEKRKEQIHKWDNEFTSKVGCASHSSAPIPDGQCPQNKIWQHCPVAVKIRQDEREKVLDELAAWAKGNLYPAFAHKIQSLRKQEQL